MRLVLMHRFLLNIRSTAREPLHMITKAGFRWTFPPTHVAEENFSTSERECCEAVWASKMLHPYLMYEKFTLPTYHAFLHWHLTINNPSGQLISWRIRLAEFYSGVKYKEGEVNSQSYALWRLNNMIETLPHGDDDGIPVFLLRETNHELEFNRSAYGVNFIDVEYNEVY